VLKNHIQLDILSNLGFEPTVGQELVSKSLADFLVAPKNGQCLLIKGYAGTGKTSIIASLIKTMQKFKLNFQLLAPTGRAAKVLSEYSRVKAFTIHKSIYRQKSLSEGVGRFVLNFNKFSNTIFIVDEASMISNSSYEDSAFGSGMLLTDLVEFVNQGKNCRLILVGDTAQLPPVGLDVSPALNRVELEILGLEVIEHTLTEVVRQQLNSGILFNATMLRNYLDDGVITQPKFNLNFNDIQKISGGELLEHLSNGYDKLGREGNVVVCYSNKRANRYNEGIRSRILYHEEELSVGDYLMVARNNYFWVENNPKIGFIANGEIVEVSRIRKYYELYGFRFADITIKLIDEQEEEVDVKIILDSLHMEGPSLGRDENKQLFDQVSVDYQNIKNYRSRLKKIKEDPFFNALQVKFAYAVTCHKAQGGQWPNIYIDQNFFREEMLTKEYLRWLYTAITRATKHVFLVNFDEAFF